MMVERDRMGSVTASDRRLLIGDDAARAGDSNLMAQRALESVQETTSQSNADSNGPNPWRRLSRTLTLCHLVGRFDAATVTQSP